MTVPYEGCTFYQYNPLQSQRSIRLLELHPGDANDNISCTLHEAELENAPKYETLSYAWGELTNKTDVLCDDKIIMVTQNLKNALLRIRLKDRSRFFWADAICTNQKDDVEKGQQIRIMKEIYANATRVCVWLGCTTAQMQPAFQAIDEIVSYASTEETRLPGVPSDSWFALIVFFSAAWFTRLWVVQEVYGHDCTVFCGEHEINWKDIVLVAKRIMQKNYPINFGMPAVINIDSAGTSSTSDILDMFRYFSCSDQRDRVYALLPFPPFCDLQPAIQPDYTKSLAEVFEEAAVRIFTLRQNLGLLSSIEHDSCTIDEEWPSWVPRWDRSRDIRILDDYASGRAQSSLPRIKHKPRVLIAEGIRISTLSWCGEVMKRKDGKSDTIKGPFQEWLSNYRPKIAHSTDPLLLSIAMTLTVGLDHDSNCPPLDLSQFHLDFLACLVEILPSLDTMLGTTQQLSQVLVEEGQAGKSSNFCSAAFKGCKNKRFFCTEDGAFGVGPRAAQIGDQIVLLYGSNAPCVLRKRGEYYQFVGECYLHQHMHGEAIKMAAEELLAVEEFEIR